MYNTFDVIKLYSNTHLYYFTRVEFPTLLDKKINPWSNLEIPYSIIQEINSRYKTADKYNLPKCDTIFELLKQVENDKLYKENVNNNLNNINPDDVTISQILSRENFTEALLDRRNTHFYLPLYNQCNHLQPRIPVFDMYTNISPDSINLLHGLSGSNHLPHAIPLQLPTQFNNNDNYDEDEEEDDDEYDEIDDDDSNSN